MTLNNGKVQGDWLSDPAAQKIFSLLLDAGYQAYAVGGCVRNALLDCSVNDVDIATNARPEQVVALAKAAGVKSIPTGIDHGTVTLLKNSTPFEVTTYRRDVETDGRRAVVAFADTIEEDARRRDFTMNALYASADGTLVDPLGGLQDCMDRRVVFIENAEARVREDYLRILRFFRFHAWYGDPGAGLDPDGLAACAELAQGLDGLSRERVTSEILKLLAAPNPAPAVAAMDQAGILTRVLPGATAKPLAPLVHLEDGLEPSAIRRLAALGGDAISTFRLSRKEERAIKERRDALENMASLNSVAQLKGFDVARDVALMRAAIFETPMGENWINEIENAARQTFPVAAANLPSELQGAAIGKALAQLKKAWVDSGFNLSKQDLLRLLDENQSDDG